MMYKYPTVTHVCDVISHNMVHCDVIMPLYCYVMILVCYHCLEHDIARNFYLK